METTRQATVRRKTRETDIGLQLSLDGQGQTDVDTGIGFLDHMLDTLARHGRINLGARVRGDLHVDEHHTVEDIGIVLGQAIYEALGERRGITRMGHAIVPMDEALALVAIDLGGRGYFRFDGHFDTDRIGQLSTSLIPHFLESMAHAAKMNLHVHLMAGRDDHHRAEAIFKALARALNQAVSIDPQLGDQVPSTKGSLVE